MLKDTKSLGNNKAPACESRGFVHKKRRCAFGHTHLLLNKKHTINVFIIIKITKGEHYGKI